MKQFPAEFQLNNIDGEDYLMIPLKNIANVEADTCGTDPAYMVTVTYYNRR